MRRETVVTLAALSIIIPPVVGRMALQPALERPKKKKEKGHRSADNRSCGGTTAPEASV